MFRPKRVSVYMATLILGLWLVGPTAVGQSQQDKKRDQMQQSHKKQDTKAQRNRSQIQHAAKKMRSHDVGLQGAIRKAESKTGGTALSARIAIPLKDLKFEVLCITDDGKLHSVTVDGKNQKVTRTAMLTEAGTPRAAHSDWIAGVLRYTAFHVVKHSAFTDTTVQNGAGQELGTIAELVVDPHSGRVIYAALDHDSGWGMDEELFAVPLAALEVHAADNVRLNVTKKELKNARGFNTDNWPKQANWRWAADLDIMTSEEIELVAHEDRMARKRDGHMRSTPDVIRKTSEIVGMTVRNEAGETLGTIDDLYIDPARSRVSYVILGTDGMLGFAESHVAIPWDRLDWRGADGFTLDISNDRLENAPAVTEGNVDRRSDPDWVITVYEYFEIDPYWIDETTDSDAESM